MSKKKDRLEYLEKRRKKRKKKKNSNPVILKPISPQCEHHTFCIKVPEDKIYDGDTVRNLSIEVWPRMHIEVDIRLARIQAPEIRTRDLEEKKAGYEAKAALVKILADNHVYLKLMGYGKYGRIIGELSVGDQNVSDLMMEQGYAEQYK